MIPKSRMQEENLISKIVNNHDFLLLQQHIYIYLLSLYPFLTKLFFTIIIIIIIFITIHYLLNKAPAWDMFISPNHSFNFIRINTKFRACIQAYYPIRLQGKIQSTLNEALPSRMCTFLYWSTCCLPSLYYNLNYLIMYVRLAFTVLAQVNGLLFLVLRIQIVIIRLPLCLDCMHFSL